LDLERGTWHYLMAAAYVSIVLPIGVFLASPLMPRTLDKWITRIDANGFGRIVGKHRKVSSGWR
jgi:hypothetical protein